MADMVTARELAALEQRAVAAEAERDRYKATWANMLNRAEAAEAEAKRLSRALEEVRRRAGLPICPLVTGLPADEAEAAAAVAECARLVVEHVTEPARAALGRETR